MHGLTKRVKTRIFQASTPQVYAYPEVHPQKEEYRGRVNPIRLYACYNEDRSLKKRVIFVLMTLSVFVFSLNIPDVSQAIIFAASIIAIYLNYHKLIMPKFMLSIALLFSFLTVHYYMLFRYGFITGRFVIQHPILLLCCYLLGCSFGRKITPKWPIDLLWVLLAMVAGFVFFAFFSTLLSDLDIYSNNFGRAGRTGVFIWTGEVGGFGPMLGTQGTLGAVLLPAFVFGKDNRITSRYYFVASTIMIILVVAGCYANLLLINRGPFIVMIVAFFISTIVYYKFKKEKLYSHQTNIGLRGFFFTIMIMAFLMICYYIAYIDIDISNFGVASRFQNQGLSTVRYEIWKNALIATLSYPLGGRSLYIGHTYAHNTWLDIGIDTGLIPMLLLLLFHINHLKDAIKIIRSSMPNTIIFATLSILIAILCAFFTEPMFVSLIYFAMTLFFLGLIKGLSFDIDQHRA